MANELGAVLEAIKQDPHLALALSVAPMQCLKSLGVPASRRSYVAEHIPALIALSHAPTTGRQGASSQGPLDAGLFEQDLQGLPTTRPALPFGGFELPTTEPGLPFGGFELPTTKAPPPMGPPPSPPLWTGPSDFAPQRLQFSTEGKPPKAGDPWEGGVLYWDATADGHGSHAWGQGELASVPDIPLPDTASASQLYVTYSGTGHPTVSGGARTAVELFVRDPHELGHAARWDVPERELSDVQAAYPWSYSDLNTPGHDWEHKIRARYATPAALVIPFPQHGAFSPSHVSLGLDRFVDAVDLPLEGPAQEPVQMPAWAKAMYADALQYVEEYPWAKHGTGSIKAARVIDHGACSREVSLETILTIMTTQFANHFKCDAMEKLQSEISKKSPFPISPDAYLHYLHASTWLGHKEGFTDDVRGGFYLDGLLSVDAGAFVGEIWITFTVGYRFTVNGIPILPGLLSLFPDDPTVNAFGFFKETTEDAVHGALLWGGQSSNDSFLYQFANAAEHAQTIDIFNGKLQLPCSPGPYTSIPVNDPEHPEINALTFASKAQCKDAVSAVKYAIDNAWQSGAVSHLVSSEDIDKLKKVVETPYWHPPNPDYSPADSGYYDANYYQYWRCAPNPNSKSPPKICLPFIPIKRVNVHPDALELVGFDGKELDNFTFALYIAAQGLPDATPEMICPFKEPEADWYRRWFAFYELLSSDFNALKCPAPMPKL